MAEYTTLNEAMAADGYGKIDAINDGKIHRFTHKDDRPGSNNCWYVSHGSAGAYGSWKMGSSHTWSDGEASENSKSSDEIRECQARHAAAIRAKNAKAATKASGTWSSASTLINHQHPIDKQYTPYGARQTGRDLLNAMFYRGQIVNVQRIREDGKKLFMKDARVIGAHTLIGKITDHVYIAEGFSTACSFHEHTGKPIIVAFNAGNLKPVALEIRREFPQIKITIAADNDIDTKEKTGVNIGLEKAREAAALVGGDFIYPDFSGEPFTGSDFNDFFTQGGELCL